MHNRWRQKDTDHILSEDGNGVVILMVCPEYSLEHWSHGATRLSEWMN